MIVFWKHINQSGIAICSSLCEFFLGWMLNGTDWNLNSVFRAERKPNWVGAWGVLDELDVEIQMLF